MRGGNTNLELWQHCFRMGMSTVCRLCPSPNSWRECYPCRKRGSGGYAGSTNPRAGCGPEARAPRPGGRWAVICTPRRSTNPRAGCGPEARAPSAGGCWSVLSPPPTACHQSSGRMRAGGRWAVICTPRRSTNPRAGCGPEARAPSAGGCWSVLGPPPTACHQSSGRMRAGGPRSQRWRVLVGVRPTTDGLPPILGQDAGRRPALPAPAGVGRCSAHHRRPATNPRAGCGPEARAPSASGCWPMLGPPPTACHQSSGRMRAGGPRSQTVEGTLCRIGKTMR